VTAEAVCGLGAGWSGAFPTSSCENGFVTTAEILEFDGTAVDRARLADLCERYGVAELSVFGSVARGEASAGSDLDLLYELAPGARLGFSLFDLEDQLIELFGRPVDLISKKSVHRLMRDRVLADALTLYVA